MRDVLKRRALMALGFAISAAFLAFFLYRLRGHWDEVASALGKANYLYVIPSVGLMALHYVCRVVRWGLFLKPLKRVGYLSLTSATCIAFMANCVLLLRAGEIIRAFVLYRRERVKVGHGLATVALARLFDVVGLSILLLVTWLMLGAHCLTPAAGGDAASQGASRSVRAEAGGAEAAFGGATQGSDLAAGGGRSEEGRGAVQAVEGYPVVRIEEVWQKGLIFAGLAAVGLCLFLVLAAFPSPSLAAAGWCLRFLPGRYRGKLMAFLASVVQAMGFMKSPGGVAAAVVLSGVQFTLWGLSTYAVAAAFGLRFGVAGGFFVTICVALAIALPQAPSFVGTFHSAAWVGAGLFQVPSSEAAAFAIVLWFVNIIPITVVGLGFLQYEGMSLRNLAKASRELAAGGGAEGGA